MSSKACSRRFRAQAFMASFFGRFRSTSPLSGLPPSGAHGRPLFSGCLLAACVLAVACSAECRDGAKDLRCDIDALLSRKELRGVRFGIAVARSDGETLFACNHHKRLIPASNQKLYTAACGLLHFGPGHRFATRVYKRGCIANGTLQGDLVIRGSGAIVFTARYTDDFDRKHKVLAAQLDGFALRIKKAGISRIEGDVLVDAGAWTDMNGNARYPAAGSVTFNENAVEIQVADGRVRTVPETVYHFKLLTRPAAGRQEKVLAHGRPTDMLRINTGTDTTDYWRIDTISAEDYYRLNIVHALEKRGIAVSGADGAGGEGETLLFEQPGIPVGDYVHRMLTDSDNVRAELLFLNLGRSLRGKASYASGAAACEALLRRHGVVLQGRAGISDGSGLSRDNAVSAENLVRLLRFMNAHTYRQVFKDALAVAGRTGTLKNKCSGRGLAGRIRAKSGSLDDVVTLSGFAETGRGELVFAFLANNVTSKARIWALYQDILLLLMKPF